MSRSTAALAIFSLVSLLAAMGNFAHGYDQTPYLGHWGSIATLGMLFFLLVLPLGLLASRWFPDIDKADVLACAILVGLPLVLVIPSITVNPIWSEDRGWIRMLGSIYLGERWNPLVPKSDYPSSWQIYPAALPFALGGKAAIVLRISILVYQGAASIFLLYICKKIYGFTHAALGVTLFLSLSTYQAFIARTGWHEISHVLAVVFLQWLFFLRLQHHREALKDNLDEMAFGLALALGFWTLYSPALSAAIFLSLYLFRAALRRSWGSLTTVCTWCFIGCLPLVAMIINRRGGLLERHVAWYLRGADAMEDHFGPSLGTRFAEYRNIFTNLIEHMRPLPIYATEVWDRTQEIHLEWCTVVFVFVGLFVIVLAALHRSSRFEGVIAPAIAIPLILLLSRPTPWRESIVLVPLILVATIGFSCLIEKAGMLSLKLPRRGWIHKIPIILFAPLFLVQLVEFKQREMNFRRIEQSKWPESYAAQNLQERGWEDGSAVWVSPDVYSYLMFPPIISNPQPNWVEYQSSAEVSKALSTTASQKVFFVIDTRLASSLPKNELEQVERLDPMGAFGLFVLKHQPKGG